MTVAGDYLQGSQVLMKDDQRIALKLDAKRYVSAIESDPDNYDTLL
ncbi:hypothetical protein M8C21_025551 [Ambrosia artemisiifolia]|uniref:Uncharacterized protein n=1 Tax=Ambrosia artemisiifolia TaxID=4212 RepID=A0AAD5GK65_AMBAR|nr:hypothetical protein M8C21_025551 [Ambrosia artemisiifolia]